MPSVTAESVTSINFTLLGLIPLLPLAAFVIIVFVTRPWPRLSGYVSITAIFMAFLLALWAFTQAPAGPPAETSINWLTIGSVTLQWGILLDRLTAVMLIVVTLVSMLVQIYSQGYMADDPGYSRYYAFMSLFTMSMLGLVLANNLLVLYMTWELVGLCSYLLIGFWFQKPEAAAAAKKAFIVTRLGDFGFLIGILIVFFITQTLAFKDLFESPKLAGAGVGWLGLPWVAIAAILLFSGAVGKSAQFPLHVWLPDAMEGPTPVSALIHAATMVAAGVYMVARLFPIFEQSHEAMITVAVIGGFTALFAATMGIVMNDIKRVMAYSTISQLGYMMMGLGVGGYVAGVFHLFNHAFFKALLFLGAGSVIHGTGTQDMREMGGLRKVMPWTYWTLMMASLSLAGIFPFSGFWSKDEILADAFAEGHTILFLMGLVGAFITAFYVTRMMLLTFHGTYRGPMPAMAGGSGGHDDDHDAHDAHASAGHDSGHSSHAGHGHGAPHESPAVMLIPLVILAILSVFTGLWNANGGFTEFLAPGHHFEMNWSLAGLSVAVALAGIGFAILVYGIRVISADAIANSVRPLYNFVYNKYGMDDLYQWIVDNVVIGLSTVAHWIDQHIVDGIVNGVGRVTVWLGGELSQVETGRLQNYALGAFGGAVVIVFVIILSGVH